MPLLAVNVDHVATLRQARLGIQPDPVAAAALAELAGARAIIVHLREDRRHIQDRDVRLLRQTLKSRLHLEMAATPEMHDIALDVVPNMVCLVPEKRRELTTEGGLGVVRPRGRTDGSSWPIWPRPAFRPVFLSTPSRNKSPPRPPWEPPSSSCTPAPTPTPPPRPARQAEFDRLAAAIPLARKAGLRVNVGHGLDYDNIHAFRALSGISEYSIGHSIMARAILTGLPEAVSVMAGIIAGFKD